MLYSVVQAAWVPILYRLVMLSARFEVLAVRAEVDSLPRPTDFFLSVSYFLRSELVLMIMVLGAGALVLLTARGALDRQLRRLIHVNVSALLIVLPSWIGALYIPLSKVGGGLWN
jgi:hypothetical protein